MQRSTPEQVAAWRARSKPLARGNGLRSTTGLAKQRAPLPQRSATTAAYYRDVRRPLVERMTGPDAFCAAPALFALAQVDDPLPHCSGPLDVHERRRRSQGGSLEEPTNLLCLCRLHNSAAGDTCRGDAYHQAGIVAFEGDPGYAALGARRGERKQR